MGDWDFINEHMGGHDEDGLPNFMSRPGFADNIENEFDGNHNQAYTEPEIEKSIEYIKHFYIIENLIERIESDGPSNKYLTQIESNALKYFINFLKSSNKESTKEEHSPQLQDHKFDSQDRVLGQGFDDFDDDIPF